MSDERREDDRAKRRRHRAQGRSRAATCVDEKARGREREDSKTNRTRNAVRRGAARERSRWSRRSRRTRDRAGHAHGVRKLRRDGVRTVRGDEAVPGTSGPSPRGVAPAPRAVPPPFVFDFFKTNERTNRPGDESDRRPLSPHPSFTPRRSTSRSRRSTSSS